MWWGICYPIGALVDVVPSGVIEYIELHYVLNVRPFRFFFSFLSCIYVRGVCSYAIPPFVYVWKVQRGGRTTSHVHGDRHQRTPSPPPSDIAAAYHANAPPLSCIASRHPTLRDVRSRSGVFLSYRSD